MNVLLWVLRLLLAAAFVAHGMLFLMPPPEIAVRMNADFSRWFQLFLGVAEVAACVGLVLPPLTRVMPWLATWAAMGIMIVMIAATGLHLARSEWSSAAITTILLGMAGFVAYLSGRDTRGRGAE